VTDQLADPATLGQVTAAFTNGDGTQNFYITQDPKVNAISLTITNGLSKTITFPPGKPVAFEKLPPGESAVYIYPNGLIDNTDVAAIKPSATDWVADIFTDTTTGLRYLVIAPTTKVTVLPGQALTFQFGNVLVGGSQRGGVADIFLPGATPEQDDLQPYVNIANPPAPGKQLLDVKIRFYTPDVYTGQAQRLTLQLINNGQTALVPGGTASWNGLTPTFQLNLVYGDGLGALTTAAGAAGLVVNPGENYGNIWQLPEPHPQDKRPWWTLQPDSNGPGTVLGAGENATIEFDITGIEATLRTGVDHAVTVAYVSWHDVPGYTDGSTALFINKKHGPVVTLTADPASVPFGQTSVQTVLTWDATYADIVRLEAPQVPPGSTFPPSGHGPGQDGINVPIGTTLTATASKYISLHRAAAVGDPITATAQFRIGGVTRTDMSPGVGSLGAIVIPANSTSAVIFQMNSGRDQSNQLSKGVILDTSTRRVTWFLDVASSIPESGGGVEIHDAVPSPDGTTIHVLVSSIELEEYYVMPLQLPAGYFGPRVAKGSIGPWSSPGPRLVATPDGKTVYATAWGGLHQVGTSFLYALDAATYETKRSWTWQPDRTDGFVYAVASNADGSTLLMSGMTGLTVVDVADVITQRARATVNRLRRQPLVSRDATRAYLMYASPRDPTRGGLVPVDVDLRTGTLRPGQETSLTLDPDFAYTAALSPDAKKLYMLTGADTLTAFDATTFDTQHYTCGRNGDFNPILIASGAESNVLYTTGHSEYTNDVVSILTVF
jgi:hypothetical protein